VLCANEWFSDDDWSKLKVSCKRGDNVDILEDDDEITGGKLSSAFYFCGDDELSCAFHFCGTMS
jgi:hypothetical protein